MTWPNRLKHLFPTSCHFTSVFAQLILPLAGSFFGLFVANCQQPHEFAPKHATTTENHSEKAAPQLTCKIAIIKLIVKVMCFQLSSELSRKKKKDLQTECETRKIQFPLCFHCLLKIVKINFWALRKCFAISSKFGLKLI